MTLGVGTIFWFISHIMPYQPEGLGIHIYRLLFSQAYANMLVRDASLRCCPQRPPCSRVTRTMCCSPTKATVQRFIHHSPKSCASSCGKVEPSRSWSRAQGTDPPNRLGEQVCKLILGVDVARLDAFFIQAASDQVVLHPDVLASFMENRVLCQSQSGLAVQPELHRFSDSVEEITKQSSEPERLSRSGGSHYVLSLVVGQGHHLLLN